MNFAPNEVGWTCPGCRRKFALKTEHHGHTRVIPIGGKVQEIVGCRMLGMKKTDRLFKIGHDSYTLAVRRACDSLGEDFTHWAPHQLRRAMGHQIREEFSLEHIQATLGHASFAMSEHNAGASLRKAIEVAATVD